jgi:RNA polymerase sigma factor (sigma-70 family)
MSDAALPRGAAGRGGSAALLSDDRLVRRATRGDQRAFAAIFRRYHKPLFRYCAAILGNADDAHDALQNTMVKVLRSLPGERREVRLRPWLYRIAHNESIELLRRRRPLEQLDTELLLDEADPAESAAARERLRRLIGDLEELPERQRGALVMRELGGLSFEQIGEAFETSPAVARQTVYEARLGLQQMNEGREMPCEDVCRALSDGDRRVARRRDIRAHLRACDGCRSFRDAIDQRRRDLTAIAPLPPLVAAGLLHNLLGGGAAGGTVTSAGAGMGAGGAAAGSSGLGAPAGGLGAASGIGKALAGSALLKPLATVAVVAAVGVSAADRSGVVHVLPGGGGGSPSHSRGSSSPASTPSELGETAANAAQRANVPGSVDRRAVGRGSSPAAAAGYGPNANAHRGSAAAANSAHAQGHRHAHHAAASAGHAHSHRSSHGYGSSHPAAHGGGSAAHGGHGSAAGGRSGESRSPHAAEGAGNAQAHSEPPPSRGEAPATPPRSEGSGSGAEYPNPSPHPTPNPAPEAAIGPEQAADPQTGAGAAGSGLEAVE